MSDACLPLTALAYRPAVRVIAQRGTARVCSAEESRCGQVPRCRREEGWVARSRCCISIAAQRPGAVPYSYASLLLARSQRRHFPASVSTFLLACLLCCIFPRSPVWPAASCLESGTCVQAVRQACSSERAPGVRAPPCAPWGWGEARRVSGKRAWPPRDCPAPRPLAKQREAHLHHDTDLRAEQRAASKPNQS